ncbi:MAG: PHP domain-containing protein [Planctomycetota bacterium]
MSAFCDLHLHSTASDGTDAPHDLPRLCRDAELSAFALTDHDTTAGLAACAAAAKKLKIDFVPGIELSANPDLDYTGRPVGTLHLLGHFIDPDDPGLAAVTRRMVDARAERNPRIIEKLNAQGVRITYEQVIDRARALPAADGERSVETMVGRPHIAQVLLEAGYVKSIHEAFTKYLGPTGGAYTRRDRLDAAEAIDAIHKAGGIASLAHPVQLKLPDDAALERFVAKLVDLGLDGIETRHSDHTPADTQRFTRLAERFALGVTGGSDYHGSRKSVRLNSQEVPRSVYEALRDTADRTATT